MIVLLACIVSLLVGMGCGAWLQAVHEENEYQDGLDALKRVSGG